MSRRKIAPNLVAYVRNYEDDVPRESKQAWRELRALLAVARASQRHMRPGCDCQPCKDIGAALARLDRASRSTGGRP